MIECQLSDKLQQDIYNMTGHTAKEDVDSKSLKFDDRGNLHIVGYKDGKRIDDCVVKNPSVSIIPEDRNFEKSLMEAQEMTRQTKIKNNIANGILVIISVLTIICLITLL